MTPFILDQDNPTVIERAVAITHTNTDVLGEDHIYDAIEAAAPGGQTAPVPVQLDRIIRIACMIALKHDRQEPPDRYIRELADYLTDTIHIPPGH